MVTLELTEEEYSLLCEMVDAYLGLSRERCVEPDDEEKALAHKLKDYPT